MTKRRFLFGGIAALAVLALAPLPTFAGDNDDPNRVSFNRDIRPIFSDRCYTCHGPDEGNRQTTLRLDLEAGLQVQSAGGGKVIAPGDPQASVLVMRVSSDDPATRMPPAYAGHDKLSPREIDLIRRWVEQGAKWEGHWSFIAPQRPQTPAVKSASWVRNPIDGFILRRLEREGLSPSPEADRRALIRRLSFDLTGLPPTPVEIETFLRDDSPTAYERVVDRLLASTRYGERMAIRWLDAARYADTSGYQVDAEVEMWRWRDWVIDSFNRNLPFDQFVTWQVAGDLLPNATLEQKIATGFNRNHRGNSELGVVDEEYRVEYVVDRVETTSTVFLGLTMGCARCHDHKYDPISQKDFYRFYAYFNNVPERGRVLLGTNSPPYVAAPTAEQLAREKQLDARIAVAEGDLERLRDEYSSVRTQWGRKVVSSQPPDWSLSRGLAAHFPLDGDLAVAAVKSDSETTYENGEARFEEGRLGRALALDGLSHAENKAVGEFNYDEEFTLAAWIHPESPNGVILSRSAEFQTDDNFAGKGYTLLLNDGRLQLKLMGRLDDWIFVNTKEPIELNRWTHIAATFDGSFLARGLRLYIDGSPRELEVEKDFANGSMRSTEPFRIGAGADRGSEFQGRIDEVRVYDRTLAENEIAMLATAETIAAIAAKPAAQRSAAQAEKLDRAFLENHAPKALRNAWSLLDAMRVEREELVKSYPSVMVMKERKTPRETFVLERGVYDQPGQKVERGLPAMLPPLPAGAPNNRLGLAQWMVDPANPLTARVNVNRFWQMLFGAGLVRTSENLGSQGEWPTHPELLDWLSVEFVESGWNVKGLLKTIVMSAAYRQRSDPTPELLERDPENRLLARGPRFRLPADMVRDQALAISGLFVEQLGGPSVKPYQPDDLWTELIGKSKKPYRHDRGDGLYRRSLYTYWKRTIGPPVMMNFDSSTRETCVVRPSRTNTPLQALNLMNDVAFVETSRKLAERMMRQGGNTPAERIAFGFELATARQPMPSEREVLLNNFRAQLDSFQTEPEAANMLLSHGESLYLPSLDRAELAAYAMTASLIFNLDETVTKQ